MPTAAPAAHPLSQFLLAHPDRLRLRTAAPAGGSKLKVNLEAGTIEGASLLTAGMQAKGWPFYIDDKTVALMHALLQGRRLKAYITHSKWGGDSTLLESGFWESSVIDGAQLRANFVALKSWRKHDEDEFDKLFELASEMPAEFGASLDYRHKLAWVRTDGSEVQCRISGWDYEQDRPRFEPSAPADAVREWPSSRPTAVRSADFVDDPGGNDRGLLRGAPIDAPAKDVSPNVSTPALSTLPTMDIKTLHAKYGSNQARLAAAIAIVAANASILETDLEAQLTAREQAEEVTTLRKFKADSEVELATLRSVKQSVDADSAKLKAAGFEAKEGKSAVDAALAEIARLKGNLEAAKKSGAGPVDTGAPAGEGQKSRDEQMAQLAAEIDAITGNSTEAMQKRSDLTAKLRALRWGDSK